MAFFLFLLPRSSFSLHLRLQPLLPETKRKEKKDPFQAQKRRCAERKQSRSSCGRRLSVFGDDRHLRNLREQRGLEEGRTNASTRVDCRCERRCRLPPADVASWVGPRERREVGDKRRKKSREDEKDSPHSPHRAQTPLREDEKRKRTGDDQQGRDYRARGRGCRDLLSSSQESEKVCDEDHRREEGLGT